MGTNEKKKIETRVYGGKVELHAGPETDQAKEEIKNGTNVRECRDVQKREE